MKNLHKTYTRLTKKYPNRTFVLFYICCLTLATLIVFLRFPNNFTAPNFYAEDGSVYFVNILELGFIKAFITAFNGYFISGLYLLTGLGLLLNKVFFQSNFADLPRSFSVVSYIFIGFSLTLPILLFKKQLTKYWAVVLVLLSAFVPLRQSDYVIFGTIGNLKWLFFYIAFLLIVYRYINYKKKWNQLIVVDLCILICAYTNSTTYLLIPIAFTPYIIDYIKAFKKPTLPKSFRVNSFWSLCAVVVLLLPQLIYVKINGIPKIPGYLDTPFQASRAIEIFIGRSFEYGFTYGLYHPFTDFLAIITITVTTTCLYLFYSKKYRPILFIGIYAVVCATLLFVINRPGISDFFYGYKSGGPDQFFYVQNLIVYFLVTAAFFTKNITKMTKWLFASLLVVFIIASYPLGSSLGRNDAMQKTRGDIYTNLKEQCKKTAEDFTLSIYPSEDWKMPTNKAQACRGVEK